MNKKLILFGTGEIAELADYYFTEDSEYEVVAFTCDEEFRKSDTFRNKPLVSFENIEDQYPSSEFEMHVALSYAKLNQIREQKYYEAKKKGFKLASYVCSKSVFWDDLNIGDNCFILENQTIQPTVKIGNNVMIWSGNHLGHGCEIKDHAYLSSHICISGHTTIGERCFIGVNSCFKDFIKIGDRVFVAMGADVTKDVESDSVVLGSKTTVLEIENEMARKIRKNYFGIE
ncbi:MAG: acetyltransferase [Ekhidna sp.]